MSLDFDADRPVVGMVHLAPLPGAPGYDDGDRAPARDAALRDLRRLDAGGVDAVMVENFGDAPFYADDVPKHVVASMTALVSDLRRETDLPLGVNVLRNDAEAAVSIAAAAGADFVRVNVHAGARLTDQGVVEGKAAETVRLRDRLDAADVSILADVDVKHSAALAERPLSEGVAELLERGHADGVVASGAGTGHETDRDHLRAVVDARDDLGVDAPVFVGSGVTRESVEETLTLADGAIVGTALKAGGKTTAPVDEDRVRALVDAAR
ncbi:BtpA/SgcQ family protein [Halobacterium rubrum]|uniref:BtpA/SgcQ family protein n=1 Tax=Halobacterium TaxID=2239 RepID=UPI001F29A570|nr:MULTISPECIES: BtpA/SgcQ family protein [Halobacterium]MDH5020616.1 BtpA/SgcQ family protein [Halobacterium rubrum]MDH5020645.1 BtpA/SgcQ family protein [Halobacterium rubrum]